MAEQEKPSQAGEQLERGSYEILQSRLQKSASSLKERLAQLNEARKEAFGSIDYKLLANEAVTTEHNCVAQDMVPIGERFIFGYNVKLGLKTQTQLSDVFSIFSYQDHHFKADELTLIEDARFAEDFDNLYKYYRNTRFSRFALRGPLLFMVFQVGKGIEDIKTFKWSVDGDKLTYIDNRSDHEFKYPDQHGFVWQKATRDHHRSGAFPHISIEDRVFVETVGGDLTIKIEDNTDSGEGIFSEPVNNPDQTLDDADVHYAIVGNIILLRIRPYQEEEDRYIVFNDKIKEAKRIDALADASSLLPDDHGIIFPGGYYLQTGDYKVFDLQASKLSFEHKLASPNGEDFLYIFFSREEGMYQLLSYNLISQQVATPILCHGYSIFSNGELCFFRGDAEPKRHHNLQIWQTPYVGANFQFKDQKNSYLGKVGNKDIVRAMAECTELIGLLGKDDTYAGLYLDVSRLCTNILDAHYWLDHEEAYSLDVPVKEIRDTAGQAIEEFEKVSRQRQAARKAYKDLRKRCEESIREIKGVYSDKDISYFVNGLADLRGLRGELIGLREMRYMDIEGLEKLEQELIAEADTLANDCIRFLDRDESLDYYREKAAELNKKLEAISKTVEAEELEERISQTGTELEMLIEVVSSLKIKDATQTTDIIARITSLYSELNQLRTQLRNRKTELIQVEGEAIFHAKMGLIEQGLLSYLDLCDTEAKCEEYANKLIVQLEELQGQFAEVEEYAEQLDEKRSEIYNAFETRRLQIREQLSRKANSLHRSGERVLQVIANKLDTLKDASEINAYYAADLMVEKMRSSIAQLLEMEESVKADDLASQLKSLKDRALRQLRDRQELFLEGENIIKLGKHHFNINTQKIDLSLVHKEDGLYYHISGTDFYELADDETLLANRELWSQSLISENEVVYRAEYLAFELLSQAAAEAVQLDTLTEEERQAWVSKQMDKRLEEGYQRGIHDHDANLILHALSQMQQEAGLLIYSPGERAAARLFWELHLNKDNRRRLSHQLKAAGTLLKLFPDTKDFDAVKSELRAALVTFKEQNGLFEDLSESRIADYLFAQLSGSDVFVQSQPASELYQGFKAFLQRSPQLPEVESTLKSIKDDLKAAYSICTKWLEAYRQAKHPELDEGFVAEAALWLLGLSFAPGLVQHSQLTLQLSGLKGQHRSIEQGKYTLDYRSFLGRLGNYSQQVVPRYKALRKQQAHLVHDFKDQLKLDSFKPQALSSFVRNQLINQVYLPIIGDNLAKQMGAAGSAKRTDLMGMLLLISPPGYGKTTLMEYVASRLGLIFMKINGPALGHEVKSLDPAQAPNAGAQQELEKLNLALEMGDNVMLYLDDIQHCHSEFLQKFISLCDAQRKIEGVYKGRSQTYDLRGKKVAVIMAGNPYTESGERFQIPDMLANRADIYNLGDILGDSEEAFKLSYLENCMTSNAYLNKIASRSQKDIYALLKLAEDEGAESPTLEANHSTDEISDFVSVARKLLSARDLVLKVNQAYIHSASQSEEYRTEPSFRLQGSYRDMNKIAEKISPLMNEGELDTLLLSHYENESQTLTRDAEANLLKLKELAGYITVEEQERWHEIKEAFRRNNRVKGLGKDDKVAQVILQMSNILDGLKGIEDALSQDKLFLKIRNINELRDEE